MHPFAGTPIAFFMTGMMWWTQALNAMNQTQRTK